MQQASSPSLPPRLKRSDMTVLGILAAAAVSTDLMSGPRICHETRLPLGTMYPVLNRLGERGWIEAWWEAKQPCGRPRRRFYQLTDLGRARYGAALRHRAGAPTFTQ
jgi:PadR family transcriptional regulator PadR